MSRLNAAFNGLRQKGESALVTFTTLGDPSLEASVALAYTLAWAGADVLELGVPFSDPVADGPTVQASYHRALQGGMTTSKVFRSVRLLRERGISKPIVLLTYYNLILRRGISKFFTESAEVGVDGVVIPDLPFEEAGDVLKASAEHDIDLIFLVAPNTDDRRLKKIAAFSKGFIYVVSLLGVTGARQKLSEAARRTVARLAGNPAVKLPIIVGFGISKPEHVRAVLRAGADGVIIGSAIIDLYSRYIHSQREANRRVKAYVKKLKAATLGGCTT